MFYFFVVDIHQRLYDYDRSCFHCLRVVNMAGSVVSDLAYEHMTDFFKSKELGVRLITTWAQTETVRTLANLYALSCDSRRPSNWTTC